MVEQEDRSPRESDPTSMGSGAGRGPQYVEELEDRSPEDERVAELLVHTIDLPVLVEAMEQQQAADAADALEHLDDEAAEVLFAMDDEVASRALAEMEDPLAVSVIDDLIEEGNAHYATRLISLMAPDDAVDLLQCLEDEQREQLYQSMEPRESIKLRRLAAYGEETAAGLMTTDYLALREEMTVAEATEAIRGSDLPRELHHLPVVEKKNRLVGIISLRELLLSPARTKLSDLMERTFKAIRYDLDQEAVAHEFDRYDYYMLPVVDDRDRLLGLVTVDDVIDIIREEQTEDVQTLVGAGKGEAVYSGLGEKFRGRFPWLLVNLITSAIAAIIVMQFEETIGTLTILAVLMPVIANQAGNAGQQSLAVTLRGIVLGEVREGRARPLIMREAIVGIINGVLAGLLVGITVTIMGWLMGGPGWRLGAVVAFSMALALTVGCFVGSGMPILMRKLGRDPATASTIFLTMITDSFSFLAFLGTAKILSGWLEIAGGK